MQLLMQSKMADHGFGAGCVRTKMRRDQLRSERVQGEDCALAIRALGLEPCTQKLDTQRIAVLVLALPTAVSCVLPRARAPPFFEAGFVDPLGGAAARAWPHERAVVLIPPAHPAHLLVLVLG